MFGNNVESIFVAQLQSSGISIDRFTFVRFRAETLKIMSTTNLFLIFLNVCVSKQYLRLCLCQVYLDAAITGAM